MHAELIDAQIFDNVAAFNVKSSDGDTNVSSQNSVQSDRTTTDMAEPIGAFSIQRFLCDSDSCGREGPESQATPSRQISNTLANKDDGGKSLSKHHV